MGFKDIKEKVIADLLSRSFVHEGRNDIDEKNLLQCGKVSPDVVAEVLKKSRMHDHSNSQHHLDSNVEVHVIRCRDWYVKFYFDPDTTFISVHQ